MSTSIDGFVAGPNQDKDNPVGQGAMPIFGWQMATRTGKAMFGGDGGTDGVDEAFVAESLDNNVYGAHIIGRNMFGPIRGEWDLTWNGWWGDNPPYHHDVFVLTHYKRDPLVMEGGTTFFFVTEGIEAALMHAQDAAGDLDVQVGGGASAVQQYLRAGLLDELHMVQVPVILGAGERLLQEPDVAALRDYEVKFTSSEYSKSRSVLA